MMVHQNTVFFKLNILWESAEMFVLMAESEAKSTVIMAHSSISQQQGEDCRAYWNLLGDFPKLPPSALAPLSSDIF